jgi:hypothetical protein
MQILRLIVLCLVCTACSGPDINEVALRDLEDAKAKGVLREGGWLPSYLPTSSNRIRLRYDVDTNEVWVSFEWKGHDPEPLAEECRTTAPSEVRLVRTQPSWWPEALSSQRRPSQLPTSYTYHACTDGSFVALSQTGETSYSWLQPSSSDVAL